MKLTPESDLDFADVRGEGEGEEADERQEDELMPEDSGYETASTIPTCTAKVGGNQQEMTARQKKKKVVDSWDDEDLEDEVEVENKNVKNTTIQDEEKPAWENSGLLNYRLKDGVVRHLPEDVLYSNFTKLALPSPPPHLLPYLYKLLTLYLIQPICSVLEVLLREPITATLLNARLQEVAKVSVLPPYVRIISTDPRLKHAKGELNWVEVRLIAVHGCTFNIIWKELRHKHIALKSP
ncbi:hypothetical protein K469DRAFT_771975 [Zopfia rhizophila CBS 207.26]|uniref:Uncharacterized protein n=1 Tax=Zopfia rhizophila CBS 207.26 TaxID=1314779 RepID=A0A6A6E674_9PEZI|nr:hypothetical protein K469DRAFT_771975 [Zopfia rhizophila CBS 207.26]